MGSSITEGNIELKLRRLSYNIEIFLKEREFYKEKSPLGCFEML